jgi:hypothetical protein
MITLHPWSHSNSDATVPMVRAYQRDAARIVRAELIVVDDIGLLPVSGDAA